MRGWLFMMVGLLSAGCTQLVETGNKANSAVRRGIYESADKIQELTRYNPPPTQPQAPQTGYCYNTMSDIICYEVPQPQLSNKLVGYQGDPAAPQHLPLPNASNTLTSNQIMQGAGTQTPFYIKEAPYVRADGEVVTSTKIMPMVPPTSSSVTMPASGGNPQSLMPRY